MILVFVLMLSTFTTVLAADRDLVHKETKEKKVFEEYLLDDSFIYELLVEGALEDYYVEVNEKLYNSAEVQEKFDEDPTVTLEEAVVGLDSVEEPTEELEVVKASAINATSITVTLAEAQDAVPAVDKFAVTVDGTANAVKEVKAVVGDTTKKNFVLTLTDSLSNKEGVLKVNNFTPSNISGADFNFDFKAPTVESVAALNSTTVEVKFSEKLNKTESEKTAAYALARVSGATAPAIQTAVLSVDGKTVTLTLATPLVDSPNGYVLTINGNTATPANNTVADVKGNKLAASERIFSGVATADETKPTLAKAAYDKTTGILVLTLNKIVLVADGNVNETDITVKGANGSYKLLETDYVPTTSTNSNQITMVLSAASKTAVAALGDTLTLDVAAGVFTDTNAVPLKNDAITGFAVEQTAAPKLASANFDQTTRLLTLTFTESDLNIQKVDISKISLGGTALDKTKSKLLTTANGKTLVIEVQTNIAVTSATTLALTAAFAENTAGTPVVPVTSQALTFVADTAKPLLSSASYNDGTGELVLNFNENVTVASITAALTANKISLTDAKTGTTPVSLTAFATPNGTSVNTTTDGKTIRLQLQGTDKTGVDALELTTLKLVIAADSFKDLAGNGNKAIAAKDNAVVTYIDKTAPALNATFNTTGFIVTAKGLTLQFTEKVNKAQAETATNYEIKSGLVDLAVTSAKLRADGKTVDLVTAEQSNLTYTVKISNVTDLAGNAYVNPTTLPSFVGNATATDNVSPELETAVYIDNGDSQPSAGDKIKLTFDEPLATVAADLTAAKLGLTISKLTSSIDLTAAGTTFAYGANNQELVITLGSAPTAPFANGPLDVTIAGTTSLKDAAGNVAKNNNSKTIASPAGALKIIGVKYVDNGDQIVSNTDTVEVKFNQAVQYTGATNITADKVLTTADLAAVGLTTTDIGTLKPGTDDTLVFINAVPTTPTYAVKVIGLADPSLTSKWGAQVTPAANATAPDAVAIAKGNETASTLNATLTSASYNKTTGKLAVKFNKTLVAKNAATTDLKGEFVFLSGGVSTTLTGELKVDTAKDTLTNELVFTVDAADKDYFASGVAQLQIKPGGTDAATNVYLAKVLPASAPITVTVTE